MFKFYTRVWEYEQPQARVSGLNDRRSIHKGFAVIPLKILENLYPKQYCIRREGVGDILPVLRRTEILIR